MLELEHCSLLTKSAAQESEEPGGGQSSGSTPVKESEDQQGAHRREDRVGDLDCQQPRSMPLKAEATWMQAEQQRQRRVRRRAQRTHRQRREGIVPLMEPRPVRVKASLSRRGVLEEKYGGDTQNKAFTHKQRKLVFGGFEDLHSMMRKSSGVISEVYSPPRVPELAVRATGEDGSKERLMIWRPDGISGGRRIGGGCGGASRKKTQIL